MILTGDVNLMNVDDPRVPFARVRDEFRAADIVFSNLECCLYDPPARLTRSRTKASSHHPTSAARRCVPPALPPSASPTT